MTEPKSCENCVYFSSPSQANPDHCSLGAPCDHWSRFKPKRPDGWIAMGERQPEKGHFVWLWHKDGSMRQPSWKEYHGKSILDNWLWRPDPAPPEPPKSESELAFEQWKKNNPRSYIPDKDYWQAGVEWARKNPAK